MDQQEFEVNFILLENNSLAASLVKGTSFSQVINELKSMDALPSDKDNEDFMITNLSQGRKFQRIKLKNKVQELGTGKLQVKIQLDKQKKQEPKKQENNTQLIAFSYKGGQVETEAQNGIILKDLVEEVKTNFGIDKQAQIIPMIGGSPIDINVDIKTTAKRYKNKVIELIEGDVKKSSVPKPVTPPKQKLSISVKIVDGAHQKQTILSNRDFEQSYENIKRQILSFAKMNFMWEDNEIVKVFGNKGQVIDRNKALGKIYPDLKSINITVERQFPGGC